MKTFICFFLLNLVKNLIIAPQIVTFVEKLIIQPLVRKTAFTLFMALFVQHAYAQNIAEINGQALNGKEFLQFYKRNQPEVAQPSYQNLLDYLQQYINFKLKVADARALKLDLDTAYQNEIAGYEKTLRNEKKISPKNNRYGYLLNEYKEGVLMFTISEQKIWNKVQGDAPELMDFYTQNKPKYEGKPFDEIKGQVISDYQNDLETTWINELRAKYPIKINIDELKKLAKF